MPGTGLDHDRSESIPDRPVVVSSSNRPRPPMPRPCTKLVIHYIGAGQHWLDAGDTAQEIWSIEKNHARPNNKPDEYNSASDAQGETWEWAGPFVAAHNGGGAWGNSNAWGHIVIIGSEIPTASENVKIIEGVRRARRQLVASGCLSPDHAISQHGPVSSTGTSCPGVIGTGVTWAAIAAPIDNDEGEDDMTDADRAVMADIVKRLDRIEKFQGNSHQNIYNWFGEQKKFRESAHAETGEQLDRIEKFQGNSHQNIYNWSKWQLERLDKLVAQGDQINDTVDEIARGTR